MPAIKKGNGTPKLPNGFLYGYEWTDRTEAEQRAYNAKYGKPLHGCYIVITSLCYENMQTEMHELRQQLDKYKQLRIDTIDEHQRIRNQDAAAHAKQLDRFRAQYVELSKKLTSARQFILQLLNEAMDREPSQPS